MTNYLYFTKIKLNRYLIKINVYIFRMWAFNDSNCATNPYTATNEFYTQEDYAISAQVRLLDIIHILRAL